MQQTDRTIVAALVPHSDSHAVAQLIGFYEGVITEVGQQSAPNGPCGGRLTVPCGRPLATPQAVDDPSPALHHMIQAGDFAATQKGFQRSGDFVGVAFHGSNVSHLDALCHVFVDGQMYNGAPASEVTRQGPIRPRLRRRLRREARPRRRVASGDLPHNACPKDTGPVSPNAG